MAKTMKQNCAAVLLTIALFGCASGPSVIENVDRKNYRLNQTAFATIGSAMIDRAQYKIYESRVWVGIINSPDGWQRRQRIGSGGFRHELLYSGRSGDTIKITYREYNMSSGLASFARQAFTQHVEYDLSKSRAITFKKYRINVLEANNEKIKFVVISDK